MKNSSSTGFGLLGLLISVALIAAVVAGVSYFGVGADNESAIQTQLNTIDDAERAKQLLEQRNDEN